MDIEAMARAMFEKLHAMNHRVNRHWATHPEEDSGAELGRDTFRAMAEAASCVPAPVVVEAVPEAANDPVPPPEGAA